MSGAAGGGSGGLEDDDLSLPKATVFKVISEVLPADVTFARDTRDLLIECSVAFVQLISSQANEICEKEGRKTIAAEHVVKALEELEFRGFIDEINEIAQEHREQQKFKDRKNAKLENSGLTQEELLAKQEELFGKARERYEMQQH